MSAIRGVIHDGKVVFDTPPAWPEGTPVEVEPVRAASRIGVREEEQGDDPESVARWLAWFDSLEPVQMKPEEEKSPWGGRRVPGVAIEIPGVALR